MPTASNSRSYQPAATPSDRRPPETACSVPVTLASTVGSRSGRTSTPVPSVTSLVWAASQVRVVRASKNGNARRAPRNRWSQAHSDSKPSSSARRAYPASPAAVGSAVCGVKFSTARPTLTPTLVRSYPVGRHQPDRQPTARHVMAPIPAVVARLRPEHRDNTGRICPSPGLTYGNACQFRPTSCLATCSTARSPELLTGTTLRGDVRQRLPRRADLARAADRGGGQRAV